MKYRKEISPFDVRYFTFSEEIKPDRDDVISDDDILNLTILLNTETDWDSFISKI